MKYLYILLLSVLTLSSCSEDFFSTTIDADPPKFDPKLFVNAILVDDSENIITNLTTNKPEFGVVNNEFPYVQGAEFVISCEDGKQVTLSERKESLQYISETNPFTYKSGQKYQLLVKKEGYPDAEAEVICPEQVELSNIVTDLSDVRKNLDGDEGNVITLTINDKEGANYFRIRFYQFYNANTLSTFRPEISLNPIFGPSVFADDVIFSDETFEGEQKELTFQFGRKFASNKKIYVYLSSISKEQYEYEQRVSKTADTFKNPFISPSPTLTNIKNGLGFFAVEKRKTYEVTIK